MTGAEHKFGKTAADFTIPNSQAAPRGSVRAFEPLPKPTGTAPYRLDLADIIPDAVRNMREAGGMSLHMVGDTGGALNPVPQELVAAGMVSDAAIAVPHGPPAFCYHLGDVIYFDGESSQYYPQFYLPYEYYPNPIFAIPGNHDADRYHHGSLTEPPPSLKSFVRNFCATDAGIHTPDSGDMLRTAMTQPNVYFTLNTPFATFIGLYTNVPEGGVVKPDQLDWFAAELRAADPDLPVIVGMHHPIHSLDAFHSGSRPMAKVLAEAEQNAGRMADLVCAGHVHNYQRFSVRDSNGVRPFIVAGFSGYHNLHRMQQVDGADPVAPYVAPNDPNVTLENYVDDRFGFIRLDISNSEIAITTYTVPRPQESYRMPPRRHDQCRYDWRRRTIMP